MKYLRIKRKKEFAKILRVGTRAHAESLTVIYMPSPTTKVAVCVGKKYGKSVVRNKIKRLLREAFRSNAECLGISCSVLLIPRTAKEYSYALFARDIGKIFRKEKLTADRAAAAHGPKREGAPSLCSEGPQKDSV